MSAEIRLLYCACCGAHTYGRQWHNQDAGYGLCPRCFKWISERETAEYVERCYGRAGEHHSLLDEDERHAKGPCEYPDCRYYTGRETDSFCSTHERAYAIWKNTEAVVNESLTTERIEVQS